MLLLAKGPLKTPDTVVVLLVCVSYDLCLLPRLSQNPEVGPTFQTTVKSVLQPSPNHSNLKSGGLPSK